jgi:hypothetical protein
MDYIKLAFDGDVHLVRETSQKAVIQQFQELGISLSRLTDALRREDLFSQVVGQYRAMKRELAWRRLEPLAQNLDVTFSEGSFHGVCFPPQLISSAKSLFDEIHNFVGPVSNHYPGYDGRPVDRARARRQSFPGGIASHPSTMKGLNAFRSAVQHKVMPGVRARVYRYIEPHIRRPARKKLQNHLARFPHTQRADVEQQFMRHVRHDACVLTASFIREFYPTFGKGTTVETVRKALPTT